MVLFLVMNKNKNNIIDKSMTKRIIFFIVNFINPDSKNRTVNVQTSNKIKLQICKIYFSLVTKNNLLGILMYVHYLICLSLLSQNDKK